MGQPRQSAKPPAGFDFTLHMRRLCEDMTTRVVDLRHIDLSRVAISFCQVRKNTNHGLYATLTPMRFAGGRTYTIRRGRRWGVQQVVDASGREMLYILSFYLPRFLERGFKEKLSTIMHELWHISPRFDGDMRRHAGRCFAHGRNGDHDAQAEGLVRQWLALDPPGPLYEFLRLDFPEIVRRHGTVFGRKIALPKLIPLD